jgi:hypothetical protein
MNGLIRLAGAIGVTALASWLVFSSFHPCDGDSLVPMLGLTLICAAAAIGFSLPQIRFAVYLTNSLGVAAVFAVAAAMDIAGAGFQSPSGSQCEPILWQGWLVLGFVYMLSVLVVLGVLIGIGLWSVRRVRRLFNPS